uniref:Flagellar basal-body rod modification protein FlgD n=1 Tax=uncultured bacterium contig00042 TaxID=1181529 RepID=A0A806JZF8_9BACT|nr:flagellar basal-body rod modification protein FlgD [uncultured bacterium contig00042]
MDIAALSTPTNVPKPLTMSSVERLELDNFVRDYNIQLNPTRQPQQSLGRDDFLKILITQLSYQDPTAPMEDKQFIAQMAQFSTLEQMTAMAGDFAKLTAMLTGNDASSALGRSVEILEGDNAIHGMVQAVTKDSAPQVMVNGRFYDWNLVSKVFAE